jgi:hypothetical protein
MTIFVTRSLTHSLTHSPTHSLTELSPSWEAANRAVMQEIPSIVWNPKVHYRIHMRPPLVPILSHINPIHTIPSYLSKIHFNIVWHSMYQISYPFFFRLGRLSKESVEARGFLGIFRELSACSAVVSTSYATACPNFWPSKLKLHVGVQVMSPESLWYLVQSDPESWPRYFTGNLGSNSSLS